MDPDRKKVRDCVIESLRVVVGERDVPNIDEQTDPMLGLGLDSADGVDFACTLSARLKYDIPDKINPLVDDEHRRARTVGEITDLVCALLAAGKDKKDG